MAILDVTRGVFKPLRLGTKMVLAIGSILVLLLLSSAGAFVYYEYAFLKSNIRSEAEQTLTVLEAVHTQAMLLRGDKLDDNPVITTLNRTFEQLTETSQTMTLWLVMAPKVIAFQEKSSAAYGTEPPRDEIDEQAMESAQSVGRMVGEDTYRLTRPVVLGRGVAAHSACFDCHGGDMGIAEGEVIGAYSIAVSITEHYRKFRTTAWAVILITLFVSMIVAWTCAALMRRMASGPIAGMSGVMGKIAEGDLEVEVPAQDRSDEIGEMARAMEVLKEQAVTARQHETELAQVLRRSTMGELASTLAHELAQPLTTIKTFCSGALLRIRKENASTKDIVAVLERISDMTRRANAIIDGIARQIRVSEPLRSLVSVNEIVRSVAPLLEADAHQHRVGVTFDLAEDLPQVLVDRTAIESVVVNIVKNGIEAIEENSAEAASREIVIRTALVNTHAVEVSVRDTGKGISREELDRIFEPFYSTKPNGMGMGLAICRTIVEQHGGRLSVESAAGAGTVTRFNLPVTGGEPGNEEEADGIRRR